MDSTNRFDLEAELAQLHFSSASGQESEIISSASGQESEIISGNSGQESEMEKRDDQQEVINKDEIEDILMDLEGREKRKKDLLYWGDILPGWDGVDDEEEEEEDECEDEKRKLNTEKLFGSHASCSSQGNTLKNNHSKNGTSRHKNNININQQEIDTPENVVAISDDDEDLIEVVEKADIEASEKSQTKANEKSEIKTNEIPEIEANEMPEIKTNEITDFYVNN